jgi:hypothetical protein
MTIQVVRLVDQEAEALPRHHFTLVERSRILIMILLTAWGVDFPDIRSFDPLIFDSIIDSNSLPQVIVSGPLV